MLVPPNVPLKALTMSIGQTDRASIERIENANYYALWKNANLYKFEVRSAFLVHVLRPGSHFDLPSSHLGFTK
jgi:hypothetical protein